MVIAIRGAGMVCAMGNGASAVRAALAAGPGATGVRAPSGDGPPFAASFDPAVDLPDGVGRRMGRQPAMALAAVLEATRGCRDLRDAALVLGTAHGAIGETINFIFDATRHGAPLASPLLFASSLHNAMCGAASRVLGMRGPTFAITNGSTSFEAALGVAVRLLGAGRVSRAVVGSSDVWHPVLGRALRRTGLTAGSAAPRTSREPPAGYFQGEGAGALLLETVPREGAGVVLESAILGPEPVPSSLPFGEVLLMATGEAGDARSCAEEWGRLRAREGPAVPEPGYPAALFGAFGSLSAVATAWEAARRLEGEGPGGATLLLNVPHRESRGAVILSGTG